MDRVGKPESTLREGNCRLFILPLKLLLRWAQLSGVVVDLAESGVLTHGVLAHSLCKRRIAIRVELALVPQTASNLH